MLSFLPGTIRGIITVSLVIINLFFWVIFLLPFAMVKLLLPPTTIRKPVNAVLNFICTRWASCNKLILKLVNDIHWDIQGDENLSMDKWYLVLSNHQSWADIVVLQFILNNRIPYFRFFLKQELAWLPIFNFVWYALDYPYMKRYSKEFIARNPHLKGKDIETTRKSCERFKDVPVAVMNFVEGTRFRPEKHKNQKSPYKHLLRPKAGGIAYVLSAMGDHLSAILDVTISYDPAATGLWKFMCGRVSTVRVRIRQMAITDEILGDYFDDISFRKRFQEWVNRLWESKDQCLEELR
ncbi:MAG: acyltransferase [Desulfobacteraceae bacterium]|nr:MAG: acyltransferase [Desulfobacteraceae bacterium]